MKPKEKGRGRAPAGRRPIRVGLLGIGTVGSGTFAVLARNQEEIARRAGVSITMSWVADKDLERARRLAGASATVTASSPEPTSWIRPAPSGAPMPDLASTWNPRSPRSQATCTSPVRSVARASRGGRVRPKISSAAARPSHGTTRVTTSPRRKTQASVTIAPLGVSIAP